MLLAIEVLAQSDVKAKRELVERVAASGLISRSARLRELFLYLCNRTLEQGAQDIHELEVGHNVFGRPPQYDTAADNIVRVHASMLRKRLSEYFGGEGRLEPLLIEIPRGNYAPLFIERPKTRKRNADFDLPADSSPLLEEIPHPETSPHNEDAPTPAKPHIPIWAFAVVSLLAVFFCALSGCLYYWMGIRQPAAADSQPGIVNGPEVRQFWANLLPASGTTEVVLDDASLDYYRQITNRPVVLDQYYDRSYLASLQADAATSRLEPDLFHSLLVNRESSFSSSALVWRIAQIADELHGSASVQFARDLTFRQVKTGNVILLGNPQSNPWIQSFDQRLSLVWVFDPVLHTFYPRDKLAPATARYQFGPSQADGSGHGGYATISFVPNLSGTGSVLILSATGGSTMGVAMDFLTRERSMDQLRSRLPRSPNSGFSYFEALLKTDKGTKELNSVAVPICRSANIPVTQGP